MPADKNSIINEPIVTPKVDIDFFDKLELIHNYDNEQQVIIHCKFDPENSEDSRIRIWPSTFLYDTGSFRMSKLLHAINISLPPDWTIVEPGKVHNFTLLFGALPKTCKSFDLIERADSMAFCKKNIKRTANDVYNIDIINHTL